ncbi:MAG: C69 family dipeptidase [Bacteroidales bacterium]|nr:C69 family dipeptidase [Bacteroidales bacterium]
MKKASLLSVLMAVCLLADVCPTDACTNIIVTRGASADGSTMVTYAADSHQLYGVLYYHPAADWPAGAKLPVHSWDEGTFLGYIDQIPHTYQTVGNMNQYQLTITETTFGGRSGLENEGGIDYGSLIYITLQRARTAREAIAIMDALTQQWGYVSEGESFSIADGKEAWIMEMVGKGSEKGTVWVARRIPDGYISAHANQARIHTFPQNDPENCLYAKDVISFARSKGFFSGKDADFSFCDAYCPIDFGGARACEARVWSAFNILTGGSFSWIDDKGKSHVAAADDYLDFAMGHNLGHKMPLFVKPAQKVSVRALSDVMRDHYEGTPMDMTQDVGAGPNHVPYRWRPMSFTVDGASYVHERAIATQQTGFWILSQSRSWLPDEIGGIQWFGVDDAGTSALTPMYTNITAVPECFREGNGSMIEYSPTSAFWQVNKVTHFAYLMYDRVAPVILKEVVRHENLGLDAVAFADERAGKLLAEGRRAEALQVLTDVSCGLAERMMTRWQQLENELLVKFMDGNIKVQNSDGSFKLETEGSDIPAGPEHPAFPERWLRGIVNDHGDILRAN